MDYPVKPQCRLCLTPSPEQYTSIRDSAVHAKLDVVFKFELPLDDSLPNVVCAECSVKVDDFYSFHEAVRTNQVQLKTARMTDVSILVLVEVKGEPLDDEETEETYSGECSTTVAAVDQFDKDDDHETTTKTDLVQNKDAQGKSSNRMPDDNWRIEQFFNGITCSICSEKFETFGKLKIHSRKAHGQKAGITCCKRKYFKKCYLIEHINSHLDSKHFYCELCKKNYGSKYYLGVHNLQFHANPEELPYQCDICEKKFSMKSILTAHLKRHVQVKCSECDRTMANIQSLKVHMLKMHSEQPREAPATHVCDVCGQVYHQKQSLERHINLQHLGAKDTDRIQCPVCAKWVYSKQYLKVHIQNAHSGKNLQVKCDICRNVYANKRALSTHKHKVHAERNLECEVCGKMFKQPKHLKEHRAAHMGQQLYTCTVCGYGSNYNGNLYTHMKNKHPVEHAEAKARGDTLLTTQDEPSEVR
ncbi:zinc finger protein 25-like [Ochlerotatus camptorhynchus]|uniref:zinc finger protein 25-like n=1 Tax=Ochlerotatus camptorhynchus TaxID=644619 RepID=UPI0031DBA26D